MGGDTGAAVPPRLFVIIPTLNEEANVGVAVRSALHHPAASTSTSYPTPTIIVADGGSTDGTRSAAARAGATTILRCPTRGRGAQLAAGLAAADADGAGPGDVILFLHADAALPDGYRAAVTAALAPSPTRWSRSWGAFSTIDVSSPDPPCPALPRPAALLLRAGVAVRTRLLSLPYGDQAIFATAGALRGIGGVRPLPLMEDVDLVTRLGAAHGRPGIAAGAVRTSPRQWTAPGRGLVRTSLRNWGLVLRWKAGVPAEELAAEYYGRGAAAAGSPPPPPRRRGARLLW